MRELFSFVKLGVQYLHDNRPAPHVQVRKGLSPLAIVGISAVAATALGIGGFELLKYFEGVDTDLEPNNVPDDNSDGPKTGTIRPADEDASEQQDRERRQGRGRNVQGSEKTEDTEDTTASGGKGELAYVTKLVAEARSFDEALRILDEHPNVRMDETLATTLFKLVKNYDDGIEFLEMVDDADVTLNVYYYNRVITFTSDLGQAMKVLNLMTDAGVQADNRTFNDFFRFARGYRDGVSIIDLMTKYGVSPDVYSFTKLMKLADSYDQTIEVLDRMARSHPPVVPNDVTFSTAFRLVDTYEHGMDMLDRMKDAGVTPQVFQYNTVLGEARDFRQALTVVDRMLDDGVSPESRTYTTLLNFVRNKEDARQVYNLVMAAEQGGFKPDEMLRKRLAEWGFEV